MVESLTFVFEAHAIADASGETLSANTLHQARAYVRGYVGRALTLTPGAHEAGESVGSITDTRFSNGLIEVDVAITGLPQDGVERIVASLSEGNIPLTEHRRTQE